MTIRYIIQNSINGYFLESYHTSLGGDLLEVFWTKERNAACVCAGIMAVKLKDTIVALPANKGGVLEMSVIPLDEPKSPMLGTPAVFTPAVFTPPVEMTRIRRRYVTLVASYVGTELSRGGPCLDTLVTEALNAGATLHGPQYFAAGFFRQCVIYSEPAP